MKRRSITGFLVIAIILFIVGIVAFGFSFIALDGMPRLIYAVLGAVLLLCSLAEFFLFRYHSKTRTSDLPKDARSEE